MVSTNNNSDIHLPLCCLLCSLSELERSAAVIIWDNNVPWVSSGYGRLPPQPKRTLTLLTCTVHCIDILHWYVALPVAHFLAVDGALCALNSDGSRTTALSDWKLSAVHCTIFPLATLLLLTPQCKYIQQWSATCVIFWSGAQLSEEEFIVITIWHEVGWGGWKTIMSAPIRGGTTSPLPTSTLQHTLLYFCLTFEKAQICTEQMNISYSNFHCMELYITLYWVLRLDWLGWSQDPQHYQATINQQSPPPSLSHYQLYQFESSHKWTSCSDLLKCYYNLYYKAGLVQIYIKMEYPGSCSWHQARVELRRAERHCFKEAGGGRDTRFGVQRIFLQTTRPSSYSPQFHVSRQPRRLWKKGRECQ